MVRAAALLLCVLVSGCAFRRGDPLPEAPPEDFYIGLSVREAATWPWDGKVVFGRDGAAEYDVTFKDPPSSRRGSEPLDEEARGRAWAAVVAAGFFDRLPAPRAEGDGPVVVEGRALRLDGRWVGDPTGDADLAALLEALRAAAPPRVFRPLPADEPPK